MSKKDVKNLNANKSQELSEAQNKSEADLGKKGHNSKPGINPALQKIFTDYEKLEKDQKGISKAKRDLRLQAKDSHGVSVATFQHEIRMRKLEPTIRAEFEDECDKVKSMLGYQYQIEFDKEENADPDADPVAVGKAESKKNKLNAVK